MIDYFERDIRARVDAIRASLSKTDAGGDVERLLAEIRACTPSSIRQAPAAAQKALARTRNPDIGIAQLVHVVEEDPTLGQSLLRYANSAYYSTGGNVIVSLRQAAQRVGVSGVHNVVLGVMLDGMLCRPGGNFQSMVDQVRTHLVRTAPIARAIARGFGVLPDEGYSLALLHDAGKLIIFDIIGNLRHELRRDVVVTPTAFSRILRDLHEPLGGLAALRWSLGEGVALPLSTHHRTVLPEKANKESELLYIAERADHALAKGQPVDVDGWWSEGSISADSAKVAALLSGYMSVEMAA